VDGAFHDQIQGLIAYLGKVSLHDFSGYKLPTLVRRVRRRMNLRRQTDLADYVGIVREDPAERTALENDLLIHVTSFFRDPPVWEALAEKVIDPLVADRSSGSSIRCWVVGCSSGEEAYTLAMLIEERAEAARKHFEVKVFATDSAAGVVETSRRGRFPGGAGLDLSLERLERYFERDDDWWRVKKSLREAVVFATQDVLRDPPFSHLDLVTCRNLLIYLKPPTQDQVLARLHFALRDGGVLVLGTAESVGRCADLFEPVDPKQRIYRRVGPACHSRLDFAVPSAASKGRGAAERLTEDPDVARIPQILVARFAPACVVVDAKRRAIYFHGATEGYLTQPQGEPTHDLVALARPGLARKMRALVRRSARERAALKVEARVRRDGKLHPVTFTAGPLAESSGWTLLTFHEGHADVDPESAALLEPVSELTGRELEEELHSNREELQLAIDEAAGANESLKASNEEVLSINEELQSSNEELETSKEELQSLNEELNTVNAQLQGKVLELESQTDDLTNLLNSTKIATLFLDREMRVRWYTPAAARLFHLLPGDAGRPIGHFAKRFTDDRLTADAQAVLTSLVPVEGDVEDDEGRWYIRRILPYRTSGDQVEGVVVTFVDVTALRRSQLDLRHAESETSSLLEASETRDRFLSMLSHELRTPLNPVVLELEDLLHRKDLPADAYDSLETARRNVQVELRLVDDLLDLMRVSTEKLELTIGAVDVRRLLREVAVVCRGDLEFRHQHLLLEGDHGPPLSVDGDSVRLVQATWNLLRNAVKFSPEGSTIRMRCEERAGKVAIEVIDTGQGIQPAEIEHIFEAFQQGSQVTSGGLGLGLAVARGIVLAHGGQIQAESDGPGQGATLRILLPKRISSPDAGDPERPTPAPAPTLAPAERKPQTCSLLLVEDHADSAAVLARIMRRRGYEVDVVADLKSARAALEERSYDVVLSDLSLPDGSGAELQEVLGPRKIPGIVLSGHGSPDAIERSRAAGFVEHLIKPILPEQLYACLERTLAAR
jgi:two-component system CheB/CheR fusion protein